MLFKLNASETHMRNLSYLRVGAAAPEVKPADVEFNLQSHRIIVDECLKQETDLLVLPELGLTAYTCGDLFRSSLLLDSAEEAAISLANATKGTKMTIAFGAPLRCMGRLFNCAVIASEGEIKGVIPKTYLPSYNEFYEPRWFTSARDIPTWIKTIRIGEKEIPFGTDILFTVGEVKVAVEICEDLWVPVSPSSLAAAAGATVTLNLSASPRLIGKHDYLRTLVTTQSARCRGVYAYASSGHGESSTDLVFSGDTFIAEDGHLLAEACNALALADTDTERLADDRRWMQTFSQIAPLLPSYRIVECATPNRQPIESDLLRQIDSMPFVPSDSDKLASRCNEILDIQTLGLTRRLEATGCKSVTIGISGGLDSTLALLVTVRAFDRLGIPRSNIHAVTMPGFGTTRRTHTNAEEIMNHLGVHAIEIPISNAVNQHFADIGHDSTQHDITYENSQARERTQILMDYANRTGGMVVGTGDLSELALGWCTYNADQMSMYGVNASVPKTLVRYLVSHYALSLPENSPLRDALLDIADTPISPELIPADEKGEIAQKTEDLVGPYDLHDFFLYNTLRYSFSPKKIRALALKAFAERFDEDTIDHWLKVFVRRFFSQQFKRSCMPDGPKVGSVCLSPRGDWRMPSDASASLWKSDC